MIARHTLPLICSLIDLFLNNIEVEFNHFMLLILYSTAYATTLYIYFAVTGMLVYEEINFKTLTSWLIMFAAVGSSGLIHLVFYYSAKCRRPKVAAISSS